jgi:hypothetical protein
MKKLLLAVIFIAGLAPVTAAKSIYVAQNSAGGNNGSDCADAHAVSFVNLASNYGSGAGQINPGDVVHLCGVFAGTPGANMINIAGSGTNGNNIVFQSDAGSPANFTAPYWSGSQGAINCAGKQYITLDGNGGAGIIQDTANGTALAYQQGYVGINNDCSNATIKGWTIQNMYIRTQGSDTDAVDGDCISGSTTSANVSNVLITGNTLNYCRIGIGLGAFAAGTSSGIEISFNIISFVDHGITIAATLNSSILSAPLIHDNNIGGGAYIFDGTTTCLWHHDGIHTFAQGPTAPVIINPQYYNNYIHGLWTQANIAGNGCLNAHIYFEAAVSGEIIFNNVLELDGSNPQNGVDGGFISIRGEGVGNTATVVNNTLVSNTSGNSLMQVVGEPGVTVENNIYEGSGFVIMYQSDSQTTAGTINYNLYYGAATGGWIWQSGFENFSQWQSSSTPNDVSGQNGNDSKLNSTFVPQAVSSVIGTGVNLYASCNGQPVPGIGALCNDARGNPRPTNGKWPVGALVSSSNANLNPASGLNATGH